ncbi:Signal peptide protein [Lysobacter dokdonensis DS-58]|uniref:Signal peptide protein n=1 Tax=Lysobacter dokdonensis DS-58 TaxID=1300345 RepID=A0A0A2WL02_9GAMM|nr:hypothetical protein [Lysobacter dokdonensis]KGQ20861.1 Signal peptide protein [Lysobacter dokdonensis DS-58]
MSALRALLVAAALAFAPMAHAQDATQHAADAAQATLAGEYHLDGVMETGSGLRLQGDGTFDWFFTYGALDLAARGTWVRAGDGIDLVVKDMGYPPQLPDTKFDRMHLRIDEGTLVPSWPWDMDDFRRNEERGAYVRE